MTELNLCIRCGSEPMVYTYDTVAGHDFARCRNDECESAAWVPPELWNENNEPIMLHNLIEKAQEPPQPWSDQLNELIPWACGHNDWKIYLPSRIMLIIGAILCFGAVIAGFVAFVASVAAVFHHIGWLTVPLAIAAVVAYAVRMLQLKQRERRRK